MAESHGPSIRNDTLYEALRKDGASKEKAARIANAKASPSRPPSRKGGKARPYETWSKEELYERARDLNIADRSKMAKNELIAALRR